MNKRQFFLLSLLLTTICIYANGSHCKQGKGLCKCYRHSIELEAVVPRKSNPMKVFAHYMPWYETPSSAGHWGWHWTMGTPSIHVEKGDIASHYHPLTGVYATNDEIHLDYQCLLMKYAGLDGMIIDWMGTSGIREFGNIHTNTQAVVSACIRNGLQFVICYDEQTALTDISLSDVDAKCAQGALDMNYVAQSFFTKKNYARHNGKPVILFFGPVVLGGSSNWEKVLAGIGDAEICIHTDHCLEMNDQKTISTAEFNWVNPTPDYSKASDFSLYIGNVMPGFKDYYEEGCGGKSYTSYDDEEGRLFDRQLAAAKDAHLEWLQITTWNDYGEGTIIEPTVEFGYRYLTKLQKFCGIKKVNEDDLHLITQWYDRMRHATDKDKDILLQCYYYLRAMQPKKARKLMN